MASLPLSIQQFDAPVACRIHLQAELRMHIIASATVSLHPSCQPHINARPHNIHHQVHELMQVSEEPPHASCSHSIAQQVLLIDISRFGESCRSLSNMAAATC